MSGTSPSLDALVCPHCGELNPEDANFCQNCGGPIVPSTGDPDDPSSETMAISVEALRKLRRQAEAGRHVIAYKTDIGKRHHVNQDAGSAWTWTRSDGTPVSLLTVADGVSAGQHSEAASRLVVEIVYERLAPLLQDPAQDVETLVEVLIQALKDANHQVASRPHFAVANADATTIVTVFVIGQQVAGAWVGDSRVYQASGSQIAQLTTDHSWAQAVVSRGLMTVEQAARDPRAHMIMRWLGPPDQEDPGIDAFRSELEPGDIIFCCSDGLYGYFAPPVAPEGEMAEILEAHRGNLPQALEELVEVALARGGHDNITVAALQLQGGKSGKKEPESREVHPPLREDGMRTVEMNLNPGAMPQE